MLSRTFICEENRDFGTNGWRPDFMPDADPYTGMAIPHDILEHPAHCGPRNPVEDEFMALGAALYIRGETGWFGREGNTRPVHEHLASDLPDIMARVWEGEQSGARRPATPKRRPAPFVIWMACKIVDCAKKEIAAREMQEMSLTERMHFIAWFCEGYRYARRRYRGHDQYTLSCLFTDIAKDADMKLLDAFPGDSYKVVVNLRRMTFESTLTHPED